MQEQLICTRCGTFIPDRHQLTWADDGQHLCYPCRERLDEANKKLRKISTGRGEIYGALAVCTIALATSLFIGWGLFVAVPSWNQARRALARSTADDEIVAALGPHRVVMTGWLWLTGGLGGALILFYLVSLMALGAKRT